MDESYDIALAHDALACLSDAERAAVGYVATTVGSQCAWARSAAPRCSSGSGAT
jgi:hypothetical protein